MHFLILLFIIIIIPIGSIMPALRFFVFELTLHLLPQLFFYAILQPQLEGKQHYHLFIKIYYHPIPIIISSSIYYCQPYTLTYT